MAIGFWLDSSLKEYPLKSEGCPSGDRSLGQLASGGASGDHVADGVERWKPNRLVS